MGQNAPSKSGQVLCPDTYQCSILGKPTTAKSVGPLVVGIRTRNHEQQELTSHMVDRHRTITNEGHIPSCWSVATSPCASLTLSR